MFRFSKSTRPAVAAAPIEQRIPSVCLAVRALPGVGAVPMCLIMSRGLRDVILVACALICAVAAIYVVYNIEVFKHRYELQILGQPDQQQ
ncbi:MAG: hypothetical protein E6G84_12710 [Alphaproteobacteria bacterium]|nr:MAG: hypothetical protein E6G84_12710 [Alphaproteobacteria bacterium]